MMCISRILFGGISFIVLMTSCSQSSEVNDEGEAKMLKNIISDESSKVWVIHEHIVEDEKLAPQKRNDKMAIVFYDDGYFYMQTLQDLAFSGIMNGQYEFKENKMIMSIAMNGAKNKMDVVHASKDSVVLENIAESGKINMRMKLLPLGKPQQKTRRKTKKQPDVEFDVN